MSWQDAPEVVLGENPPKSFFPRNQQSNPDAWQGAPEISPDSVSASPSYRQTDFPKQAEMREITLWDDIKSGVSGFIGRAIELPARMAQTFKVDIRPPAEGSAPESGVSASFKRGLGEHRNDMDLAAGVSWQRPDEWEDAKQRYYREKDAWQKFAPRSNTKGAWGKVKEVAEDVSATVGPMAVSWAMDLPSGELPGLSMAYWQQQGRGAMLGAALAGIDTTQLDDGQRYAIDTGATAAGALYSTVEQLNRFRGKKDIRRMMERIENEPALKKYVKGVIGESAEEGLQQVIQDIYVNYVRSIANPSLTEEQRQSAMSAFEILTNAGKAFAQSIPTMMVLGAGNAALDKTVEKITGETADKDSVKALDEWAQQNPDKARVIAGIENPSRSDFEKAGLPRVSASKRASIAGDLREILGPAPAETPVEEDQEQPAPEPLDPNAEPTEGNGEPPPPSPEVTTTETSEVKPGEKVAFGDVTPGLTLMHEKKARKVQEVVPSDEGTIRIDFDDGTSVEADPNDLAEIAGEAPAITSPPESTATPTPPPPPVEDKNKGLKEPEKAADEDSTLRTNETKALSTEIRRVISGGERLSWQRLFDMADKAYGGTRAEGKYQSTDAYEALELAVNLEAFGDAGRKVSADRAKETVGDIEALLGQIPTQTIRSEEKDDLQQFSTPPHYAYAANWVAGIRWGDVVVEPSAGTGSLVAHARASGAHVVANELSKRRAALVRTIAHEVYTEDAEQLDNILPESVKPDVVVMNPPFSRAGNRIKGQKLIDTASKHIEQALKRLKPGGRLVAITGRGMAMDRPHFAAWWAKIGTEYRVRANVGVGGAVYAKYGTAFETQLIVIDKMAPDGKNVQTGDVQNVGELIDLLREVRDERAESTAKQEGSGDSQADERPSDGGNAGDKPTDSSPGDTGDASGQDKGQQGDDAGSSGSDSGDAGEKSGRVPVRGGRGSRSGGRRGGRSGGASGNAASSDDGKRGGVSPEPDAVKAEDIGEVSAEDFSKMLDEAESEMSGKQEAPKVGRKDATKAPPPAPPPADTRTPGEALKSAGQHALNAASESVKALDALFGKPSGKLGMGAPIDFDAETYAKAKPHLEAALKEIVDAGGDLKAFMKLALSRWGAAIKPYLMAFHKDLSEAKKDLELEERKAAENTEDHSSFETYSPSVTVKGAQPHPSPLVESAAMASVKAPKANYKPSIPDKLVSEGALSDAQLEPIIMAGVAHSQTIPTSRAEQQEYQRLTGKTAPTEKRRGFFDGDGTGVGKGRIASGIILDNWNKGRKRAVWISEKRALVSSAVRDWTAVGGEQDDIIDLGKVKAGNEVEGKKGILFSTYDTLGTASNGRQNGKKTRVEQIVDWFGSDYDGVVILDESHGMGNAVSIRGSRGRSKPAAKALMGVELQARLPNARVVYMSATGATEVSNLSYADRLGLWGEGTAFQTRNHFVNDVSSGGIAAMELVARDMKALGAYLSRTLSFKGVGYKRLTHGLDGGQRKVYDNLADAWQVVLRNIERALEATAGVQNADGTVTVDSKTRAAAMSAFWGAHQRFFNQILTSMQIPSVITSMKNDLAAGKAVVLQIVNTLEASTERELAKMESPEDLETLDITPRDQLIQMLAASFPVKQMEQYTDTNGNLRWRLYLDSNGKEVLNREAVAARDRLIDQLASIAVPESPLDQIINHFGYKNVAEVTGRKRRVVIENGKRDVQARSDAAGQADVASFMDGNKDILIFSDKGGTGASYHADLNVKNQKPRAHYVLQAGWRADKAIQGLGRSHRSNQAHAPEFVLVETDLPGHKRFISTIARRLQQLGALSKGQRETGGGGLFSESDNLESTHAEDALENLIRDICSGDAAGIDVDDFEAQTGLRLRNDQGGVLADNVAVRQFLNRLLSMNIDMQNKVFDAYSARLEQQITVARATGTLDVGMEQVKAKKIEAVSENVVSTDARTGAQTKHVELAVYNTTPKTTFENVLPKVNKFVRNRRSGKVYGLQHGGTRTETETGRLIEMWIRHSPGGHTAVPKADVIYTHEDISEDDARAAWDAEYAKLPDLKQHSLHMITGALLPIWTRLRGRPTVKRAITTDGSKYLGRVVPEDEIDATLAALGVHREFKPPTTAEAIAALNGGGSIRLDNRWKIYSAMVSGDSRIEVVGPASPSDFDEIRNAGGVVERFGFKNRAFIPTGAGFSQVYERITRNHPVEDWDQGSAGDMDMPPTPATVGGSGGRVGAKGHTQAADIISTVRRLWPRLSIRGAATFKKRARGWYNLALREMRTKDARDIDAVLHELGHYFDDQLGMWSKTNGLPAGVGSELIALGRAIYGNTRPKMGYRPEGFAEFIREYLTGSPTIQSQAPNLYDWFTTDYLPSHPDEARKLAKLEQVVHDYRTQTPEQMIRAFRQPLREDWSRQRIAAKLASVEAQQRDINLPVLRAMQEAGIGDLDPSQDPYMLLTAYSRSAGGRAKHAVLGESIDLYGRTTGEGLRQALSPVVELGQDAVENWKDYAIALKALVLHGRGINPGITEANALAVKNKYQSQLFDQVTDAVTEWSRRQLRLLVDAGAMTQAEFEEIERLNPVYVPFARQFAEGEIKDGRKRSGRGIYRIKGSGREIHDPLDALILQSEKITATAMQADVVRALVNLYDANKGRAKALGTMMSEVPAPLKATTFTAEKLKEELATIAVSRLGADPAAVAAAMLDTWNERLTVFTKADQYKGKSNIVSVVVNGERRFFEVKPELVAILEGVGRTEFIPGRIGDVNRFVVGLQRLGATGLNPAFGMIRNMLRDTATASITSDYHFHFPVYSTLAGVVRDIIDTADAQRYHALGLDISGRIGQDMRMAKKMAGRATAGNAFVGLWREGIINGLREVLSHSEVGPRLMEFRGAWKHGMSKYGNEADAAILAACASKDVTVNFSRAGSHGRFINEVVLFWNAAVQSVDKALRSFGAFEAMPWAKSDSRSKTLLRTAARGALFLSAAAILNYLKNRDEDWWKDLPEHEKWNYIHVKLGGKVIRIPLPFEMGAVFASLPVASMEESRTPGAFNEAFKQALNTASPLSGGSWHDVARNISSIGPIADLIANRDWKGDDIVPANIERYRVPADQYTSGTGWLAREMGKVTGYSPAKIEHLLNGYTGGIYKRTASLIETAKDHSAIGAGGDLSNVPLFGTLFLRKGTSRVASGFYDRLDELRQKKGSGVATLEERGELANAEKLSKSFQESRQAQREAMAGGVSAKVEKEQTDALMTKIQGEIKDHSKMGEKEYRSLGAQSVVYAATSPEASEREKAEAKQLLAGLPYDEVRNYLHESVKAREGHTAARTGELKLTAYGRRLIRLKALLKPE